MRRSEAQLQFEIGYALVDVINSQKKFEDIEFEKPRFEVTISGIGRADIVLYDKSGKAWLVIETKTPLKTNDPFNPKVIDQAWRYADWLGAYFFATCDGRDFVLFDNKERGVSFWERKRIPPYDLRRSKLQDFARRLLNDIVQLELGTKKWSSIDEAFVSRLKLLHERFVPMIAVSLKRILKEDPKFKLNYKKWLDEQGFSIDEKAHLKVAIEGAYLLINKILFYKVLETKYPELVKLGKIGLLDQKLTNRFRERLAECFNEALKIDYKAVFQHGIYDDIPLSEELVGRLNEFLDEASNYDLSRIESDVVGRIYERLIPRDERHALGQYYTPPAICDLIVRFCIDKPNAYVLDPGSGSGGFLIKAYYRLLELDGKITHQQILRHLWGIDISLFPAHLSVINLALRNLKARSDIINVIPEDFFKIHPQQKRLIPLEKLTLDNVQQVSSLPPQFDAVVCNPPYTRYEDIGDKNYRELIRKHSLSWKGRKLDFHGKSPIFAYFFVHSAKFLKENGKMGFIVSNSWMDAKYGLDLETFLLDNFRLETIIEFDKRAFEEAAVNTVVIIMEKLGGEKNRKKRELNKVKFVRIKKSLTPEEIITRIRSSNESQEDDKIRIVVKTQKDLKIGQKWMRFFRQPRLAQILLKHNKMCKLSDLGEIHVGIRTLANKFFVIDKKKQERFNIESEFLLPLVRTPRQFRNILDIREIDLRHQLFYATKPEKELKNTNALMYIKDGEKKRVEITRGKEKNTTVIGFNNTPALRNFGNKWYRHFTFYRMPILIPDFTWERTQAYWNKANAVCLHSFYGIIPFEENHLLTILGYLNSSFASLYRELFGRTSLGEGVLRLMKHDLTSLPILDCRKLSNLEKESIEQAFLNLVSIKREGKSDIKARKELDKAIGEAFDLNKDEIKEIREAAEELMRLRKGRAETEVLLDHPETKKRGERTKQRRMEEYKPRTTLEKWLS